jgi:alpha-1,3-fucosyltransferase
MWVKRKKSVFFSLIRVIIFAFVISLVATLLKFAAEKTDKRIPYKAILIWNRPDRIETSSFGIGREPFLLNGCPVTACEIFVNRSAFPFSKFDAVIMNMHVITESTLPDEDGYNRSSYQRYVFFTQESPQTMPIQPSKYRNYFNWTMSYRWDSDVRLLYGRIRPLPSAPADEAEIERLIRETHKWTTNYAPLKNKTVAWMVSHCVTDSLREKYVQELSKYIDVDVYGRCGKLKCARNDSHWLSEPECYTLLEREYKFYLSFENSVCTDYVTEKFFNILKYDLVLSKESYCEKVYDSLCGRAIA